jgi:hypothetical protein
VRRRDHGRVVEAEATHQDGSGRGRQDASHQRLPAGTRDPVGQRSLEHRPGLARVADDQALGSRGVAVLGHRPPERPGELAGELLAGDAANSVCAEELHGSSQSRVRFEAAEAAKSKQTKDAGGRAKRA